MLVALLQPAPETFELFDDVMLLASGIVLYHGPRDGEWGGLLPMLPAFVRFPSLHSVVAEQSMLLRSKSITQSTTLCRSAAVMPFFRTHLGFDCPVRKGVADFLQEIALPSDQQARAG